MSQSMKTQWDSDGSLEVLTFNVGEEVLALEAVTIQEIVDLLPETLVPGAAPLVGSVVNFRGRIIPIADLRLAFGMPVVEATVDSRIVVVSIELEGESFPLGLRTDKVHEVATLRQTDSVDPPAIGMRWRREYVREFVRQTDGIIILPDLAFIFEDLASFGSPNSLPATSLQ